MIDPNVLTSIGTFLIGFLLGWGQGKIEKEEAKRMATAENQEAAVPACEWCRMGLHVKCEKKHKLHAVCVCDCERGY